MSTNTPGFYGKLPAKGDFVSRHLAYDFVQTWDQWLQDGLIHSQELLQNDWQQCFQTSPYWCFALTAGVCGHQAVVGVMAASRDRVGRDFPITIALLLEDSVDPWYPALHQSAWYQRAGGVLAQRYDHSLSLEQFTEQVSRLGSLSIVTDAISTASNDIRLSTDCSGVYLCTDSSQLAETLQQARQQNPRTGGLWWHQGNDHLRPCLLVAPRGLPTPRQFFSLLTGNWQA
jgi:type VI secretion system protein ImpM